VYRLGVDPRLVVLALVTLAAGCGGASVVGRTRAGDAIVRIPLQWSNAYLVEGMTPLLVDAGSEGDLERLERGLAERDLRIEDLGAVVLTHGHADHAGLGAELARRIEGPVIVGAGDVHLTERGHNDEMHPTDFVAALLELVIPHGYPRFAPDVIVEGSYDLRPLGIEATVELMPGHTGGSLVVHLGGGLAIVGDQIRGGELGGLLFPEVACEHYFHDDREQNRASVELLLARGVHTFFLGHGGPVSADSVRRGLDLPRR
jgi:hydroxyacylglutathione hydrolase